MARSKGSTLALARSPSSSPLTSPEPSPPQKASSTRPRAPPKKTTKRSQPPKSSQTLSSSFPTFLSSQGSSSSSSRLPASQPTVPSSAPTFPSFRPSPPALPAKRQKPNPSASQRPAPRVTDSDSDSSSDDGMSPAALMAQLLETGRVDWPSSMTQDTLVEEDGDEEEELGRTSRVAREKERKREREREREKPFRPTVLPFDVEVGSPLYVKHQHCWWPGILKAFHPAQSREEQTRKGDRYEVSMYTGEKLSLRRSNVLFTDDDGVADCTLGHVETTVATYENDATTREATPGSRLRMGPISAEAFASLPREEQLARIRPHLQRIIAETFPPAQTRIDRFYNNRHGGPSRVTVMGDISTGEMTEVFMPELQRWALRSERWIGYEDAEHRPQEPPRPTGSARYEKLTPAHRRRFISIVLLPESIIQLCTLSDADLHARHLASPDSQETYEAALTRLDELNEESSVVTWEVRIQDLKDARRLKRRELGMEPEDKTEEERQREELAGRTHEVGWAGSRHRKILSYREE